MPKVSRHRNYRKTYRTPARAFEKERLDQELKLLGEYGLRCKREIWRVQFALSKLRKAARELLTLEAKDPKRLFEGAALLRRLKRYGLLSEDEGELDFVLRLNVQKLLERRLQTKVFKQGLAKSVHHARVLIKQRHIRVGKQLVDVPSFMVRLDSEKHIDFTVTSPYGQGRPVSTRCIVFIDLFPGRPAKHVQTFSLARSPIQFVFPDTQSPQRENGGRQDGDKQRSSPGKSTQQPASHERDH